MEYYTATKIFITMWMDLESVIQSEASQKERKKKTNIIHLCVYLESRKVVQMNLFAGQEERCRCREQLCGHRGERRGWVQLRE